MVTALARDLLSLERHEILLVRDPKLPQPLNSRGLTVVPLEDPESLDGLLDQADGIWPIAPEGEGLLEALCQRAEARGKVLLSSPSAAVRITASKLETQRRFSLKGLPGIPTEPLEFALIKGSGRWPRVIKPDDGAGSEDTMVVDGPAAVERFLANTSPRRWVLQPYVRGRAMSLSTLFRSGEARLLSVNAMAMTQKAGRFKLDGLTVNLNLAPRLFAWFEQLSSRIAAAFPELWGYAGIDFLWDGHGPRLLEINPRLTSAFIGLGAALNDHPARWVLDLAERNSLPVRGSVPRGNPQQVSLGVS